MPADPTPAHTARLAVRRTPPGHPAFHRLLGAAQTVHRHHPDLPARKALDAIKTAVKGDPHLTALLGRETVRSQLARTVWGPPAAQPGSMEGAARAQLAVARRMVGWIAEPGGGLSALQARKVRITVAWVGCRILGTDGWDTTLFTGSRMATELGLSWHPTARGWVRLAAAEGAVKAGRGPAVTIRQKGPRGGGGGALWEVGKAPTGAVLDHVELIEDLVAAEQFGIKPHTMPGVAVLGSVAHPLWTYSGVVDLGVWDAWLSYLLKYPRGGTFGVDEERGPLPKAMGRALKRLRALGIDPDSRADDILASIDAAAGRTRAYDAKRAAEETAAAATEARLDAMKAHQAFKKIMAKAPDGGAATSDQDAKARYRWLANAQGHAKGLSAKARLDLQGRLAEELVRGGWPEERAVRVSGVICTPPEPPVAAA